MAEIATKLLAPRIVTKKRHAGHSWEYEERVRGSIYVEDGELEETSFIHCKTLDCDGRYVEDDFGFFKVTPDMFHVEERRTYDKTKTYLNYYLTEEGLDKLKEQGCPGLVVFDVVSRGVLEEAENDLIKQQQNISTRLANIDALLNEDIVWYPD
tara:strand:- start:21 stop:482 length:462 start_codon:yes stop_codon:yes gene_type:complete